jgi:hypothetical protein
MLTCVCCIDVCVFASSSKPIKSVAVAQSCVRLLLGLVTGESAAAEAV